MKKSGLFTVILIVMITISGYSQNGFNYKALISDNGNALAGQNVTLRFTILENGTTSVYEETHDAVTDAHGIVSVQVGEGSVVSGDFGAIDWSQTQFLKVEIDTGNGFEDFGTSALQYVPYAKYADKAGNVFSGNYGDLTGTPDFTGWDTLAADDFSGDYNDLANRPDFSQWDTVAADDFSGDYNDLVNKPDFTGWDTLAADDFSGDYGDLTNIPAVFTLEGDTVPAMHSTDNIQHRGSILIGDSISGIGAGTSSLRINRRTDDNQYSYGIVTVVDGSGDGYHYGNYNVLTGSGNGGQVGTENYLSNTGKGAHIGTYNIISDIGSGSQYYDYGTYNYITGSGDGIKYGSYNYISLDAGGTHYAVVGSAQKAGSYAGYFLGDVLISRKLKSQTSGDADMKAYIYGAVLSNGTIVADASSGGFTLSKVATGRYRITFNESPGSYTKYVVIVSFWGGSRGFITTVKYSNYFEVQTRNTSDILTDMNFDFVVYRK